MKDLCPFLGHQRTAHLAIKRNMTNFIKAMYQERYDGWPKHPFCVLGMMSLLSFFTFIYLADKIHREVCYELLDSICKTNEQKAEASQAVGSALDVLNGFLTGVQKNYC